MGWSGVLSRVQGFLPTDRIAQVTTWVNKVRSAYEAGSATVDDVVHLGQFFNEQFQLLKQINKDELQDVIQDILHGTHENKYRTLVNSMTFDELMAMQQRSTDQIVAANNAKLNQLEAIRTIAALPGKIQGLVALVF